MDSVFKTYFVFCSVDVVILFVVVIFLVVVVVNLVVVVVVVVVINFFVVVVVVVVGATDVVLFVVARVVVDTFVVSAVVEVAEVAASYADVVMDITEAPASEATPSDTATSSAGNVAKVATANTTARIAFHFPFKNFRINACHFSIGSNRAAVSKPIQADTLGKDANAKTTKNTVTIHKRIFLTIFTISSSP